MWRLIVRSIAVRKTRTFLTVVGITIGIAMFVTVMSIGQGLQSQLDATLSQWEGGVTIIPKRSSTISKDYVGAII